MEDLLQLPKARLDQKRLFLQHMQEGASAGIHDAQHASAAEPLHDLRIDGVRHALRHAARHHQHIAFPKTIQHGHQRADLFRVRLRSLSVHLCFLFIEDLDIDPGKTVFDAQKGRGNAAGAHTVLKQLCRHAGHEAKRDGIDVQMLQHDGNIHTLSAIKNFLAVCAVDLPRHQLFHFHQIIQ